MTDCGHASGVTYAGCMKCDLDRQKDRIKELEAENARLRKEAVADKTRTQREKHHIAIQAIENILKDSGDFVFKDPLEEIINGVRHES